MKTGEQFSAYRIPATASPAGSFGCEIVLWRVRGEVMVFFIRPGWEDLRAMLVEKYWVGLATHADLDYAIEAARILARNKEHPFPNDFRMHQTQRADQKKINTHLTCPTPDLLCLSWLC